MRAAMSGNRSEMKKKVFMSNGEVRKRVRVLLIEDDRSTRRMVCARLEEYCDVVDAGSVRQGISAYNSFQPDLVFMDIELPDGDGKTLLNRITRNDPGAFVVMFSGHSDTNNVLEAIDAGARGFIAKPFDLSKMLHFIRLCPQVE